VSGLPSDVSWAYAMQLREAPGELTPKSARALEPFGTGAYF